MFSILVVDDDKIERDGIRFLIRKKELPLQVEEAENGEKALQFLQTHKADILFTDIKMPFMDGLQLAERAAAIQPKLKIVILSAFGEFEYAKRAIRLDVFHYLLKPIEVDEFTEVMHQVIRLCEEDRERERRESMLMEGYRKGLLYEKERFMLDLLHGSLLPEAYEAKAREAKWGWDQSVALRLLLLDMDRKFFESADKRFDEELGEILPWQFEYVNLNEYQSILFLRHMKETGKSENLHDAGSKLQEHLKTGYGANAVLVFSGVLHEWVQISSEYERMDQELENKFFYPEPPVLLTEIRQKPYEPASDDLNQTVEEIAQLLKRREKDMLRNRIEQLFGDMEETKSFSTIYVKYICTEIVKAFLESGERSEPGDFQLMAERIFKTPNLHQLKHLLIDLIDKKTPNGSEPPRKSIEQVLQLIHRDYRHDISLESLAEKVYLSPSYLSRLFKSETGTSIVKYITSYRLKMASDLLRMTNKKIVDISTEVGYTNFSYFCSIFRNYYGATPSEYRDEA